VSDNYFDYVAKKTAPKPSHRRLPPSKAPAATPEPKSDGIVVEESTASDSMIVRIIGKFRGQ
jgi:hypothetical protein